MNTESLSVIIPTKNRLPVLLETMKHLKTGSTMPDEVIVVDDCSDPAAAKRIKPAEYPFPIKILRNQMPSGAAASRNRGIREAQSALLLLMDDDVWVSGDMIFYHKHYHAKYSAIGYAVLGRVFFDPMMRYTPLLSFIENHGSHKAMAYQTEGQLCDGLITANVSIKRRFLENKQLFDESFPFNRNEDTEFGQRMLPFGFTPCFHNAASAAHHSMLTMDDWNRIQNQSGQCKAHWTMIDPEGCVFIPLLERVVRSADMRKKFEAEYQAGIDAFGQKFLDADVSELPREELEIFYHFMQESQAGFLDYGMLDYYAAKVPEFHAINDLYRQAEQNTGKKFDVSMARYMETAGDLIPAVFAGLQLCNNKKRHDITCSSGMETRSNWLGIQVATALFETDQCGKALEICEAILARTGSGRAVDKEQRNRLLDILNIQQERGRILRRRFEETFAGVFFPWEFQDNRLKKAAAAGPLAPKITTEPLRYGALTNSLTAIRLARSGEK